MYKLPSVARARTRALRHRLASLLGVLVILLCSSEAHAGGLFLFDRGARPSSRGGAFVAAPDDPHALYYNPAGLAESRDQLLMDATLTIPFFDFQRRMPGPNPIEKRSTRMPHQRATMRCPASCTMIMKPSARIAPITCPICARL